MDLVDRHQKYIDVLLDYEKVFSVTEYMQTFGRHPLPEKFGITNAYKYIISIYPELKDIFKTKKSIVASIKQAVNNQEILSTTGKFHVNYNAGYRTPSGEGRMPINYDKIDRESLEKWAASQIEVQSDNNHDSELSRNHDVPPLYPELETEEFGGKKGNRSHTTRIETGIVPLVAINHLKGAYGEIRGNHVRKQGESWEAFKADIFLKGINEPILILKYPGCDAVISEGNHRLDAAMELGLGEIPVEIRYFGRSEDEGLAYKTLDDLKPSNIDLIELQKKVFDLQKKDDVDQIHKLHDNYWQDSKKQGADPETLVIKLIEAGIYEAAPENNWLCLPDPGMCLVDTVDSEDGQKFNIYVFESRDGEYDTFFKRPYNQVEYDFWEIKESEDYPYEFPDMLQKIVAFNDKYGQHGFSFFDIQTAISKGEFSGFPEVEMPQPENVPETENFGPGM